MTRAVRCDVDPAGHAADLVARSFDEHAVLLQATNHPVPRPDHIGLLILTEHVERTDDRDATIAGNGNLEAAESEVDARVGCEGRRACAHLCELREGSAHPVGFDLEAEHVYIRSRACQPLLQFQRRDAARTVAEVDDERVVRAPDHRQGRDPAIDAAEAVRVGGAAGDGSDRSAGRHASSVAHRCASGRIRSPSAG